jgi:hypothetical protein
LAFGRVNVRVVDSFGRLYHQTFSGNGDWRKMRSSDSFAVEASRANSIAALRMATYKKTSVLGATSPTPAGLRN